MKVIPDTKYPNMFRVQWPNGDISVSTPHPDQENGHYGFYNKTRAKEFLARNNVKNYKVGKTYKAPMARLDGR